jgi:hypothetical protein
MGCKIRQDKGPLETGNSWTEENKEILAHSKEQETNCNRGPVNQCNKSRSLDRGSRSGIILSGSSFWGWFLRKIRYGVVFKKS